MKVDHKDVKGAPALRALFNLAHKQASTAVTIAPVVAADSAAVLAMVPHAGRFGTA